MATIDKCNKCGRPLEFSHTENNSKGRFDVYYCDGGHEVKVLVGESKKTTPIKELPRR